ncbi:VOC family protein [Paenibacillus marinisediminis]
MLHHVEINVSDLQCTTEFWGWLLSELGYTSYQQWPQGVSWKYGSTYIVFVQTESEYLDIPYHRKRAGLNHLAFQVESKEQVDTIAKKLEARGVTLLYQDRYPHAGGEGHYAVFFEDPDRIKVEIVGIR